MRRFFVFLAASCIHSEAAFSGCQIWFCEEYLPWPFFLCWNSVSYFRFNFGHHVVCWYRFRIQSPAPTAALRLYTEYLIPRALHSRVAFSNDWFLIGAEVTTNPYLAFSLATRALPLLSISWIDL